MDNRGFCLGFLFFYLRYYTNSRKFCFVDAVATSERSCLVAKLAKMLQQNGVNIFLFYCLFVVSLFCLYSVPADDPFEL